MKIKIDSREKILRRYDAQIVRHARQRFLDIYLNPYCVAGARGFQNLMCFLKRVPDTDNLVNQIRDHKARWRACFLKSVYASCLLVNQSINHNRRYIMARLIVMPYPASCRCCGLTQYELKPFSSLGNPKITEEHGDAVLVKSARPDWPFDEEVDRIWKEFFGGCHTDAERKKARAKLVKKYGRKRAKDIEFIVQAVTCFSSVYQCKDCAILSDDEYCKKLNEREFIEEEQGRRRAFLVILDPAEWKIVTKYPERDWSDDVIF